MSEIQNQETALRILNKDTAKILEEKLLDSEDVILVNGCIVARNGNVVTLLPVTCPSSSVDFNLDSPVEDIQFQNDSIFVLTADTKLQRISDSSNPRIENVCDFSQVSHPGKVPTFASLKSSFIFCVKDTLRDKWKLYQQQGSSLAEICSFDFYNQDTVRKQKEKPKLFSFSSPKPSGGKLSLNTKEDYLFFSTPDGHLYEVFPSTRTSDLLCDLQQGIKIVHYTNNSLLVAGKLGKVILLDLKTKQARLDFTRGPLLCTAFSGNSFLFQDSSGLYAASIDTSSNDGFLKKHRRLPVTAPRTFSLEATTGFIHCLDEDGLVYRFLLTVESSFDEAGRNVDVKTLLEEIHAVADATKAANLQAEEIRQKLQQLSAALFLLNDPLASERFTTKISTYSNSSLDVNSQTLQICIENNSTHEIQPPFWSLQVCVTDKRSTNLSTRFQKLWKPGSSYELLHKLHLEPEIFSYQIKISLVFSMTVDGDLEPLCVTTIHEHTLGILDFLEPAQSSNFGPAALKSNEVTEFLSQFGKSNRYFPLTAQEENGMCEEPYFRIIGLSKKKFANKSSIIQCVAEKSWNRGFQYSNKGDENRELYATFSGKCLKFAVDETKDSVYLLQIEAYDETMLQSAFEQVRSRLQYRSSATNEMVKVPREVIGHVERLQRRLRYITSLETWTREDLTPIAEEFHRLKAVYFPIQ